MNIKLNKPFQILLSISFALTIIILSVKFALNFRPLYYFDMGYLKIHSTSGLSQDDIKENYDYVINYMNEKNDTEFQLPSLSSSQSGKVHFEEVKNIFIYLDKLLIACIIINIIGILKKPNIIEVLKRVSTALLAIPSLIMTAFAINFDASFTIFHKIFFRNDYWIFDPNYDPIINILPEEFFFHCALLILFIIIFVSIILKVVSFKLCKKMKLRGNLFLN